MNEKNILFPHDFREHIQRLIDLGIMQGKGIILPSPGEFLYRMEFKYDHEDKKPINYKVYIFPTSIIMEGQCIKHNWDSECSNEIRDALELLLFQTKESDDEIMYYMGILQRHLETVELKC